MADCLGKIEEILKRIDSNEIAELTSSLVRFPSVNPPGREKDVAEFVASWFTKRGFKEVELAGDPERPNVVVTLSGQRGSSRKTLIFNGHLDVVPEGSGWTHGPFSGKIVGGRVYGRGSADMKGGIACMMIALEKIREYGVLEDLDGTIIFTAVADEETGGPLGTSYLVRERGLKGDFAIVGEPTGLKVCTAHKGNITFQITTKGRSAHASVPHLGVNAIIKMNEVINGLIEYSKSLEKRSPHPLLGKPTINIGVINGGTKSNIVPDSCTILAERRVLPSETLDEAKSELERLLAAIKSVDKELEYTLEFKSAVGPSEFAGNQEWLQKMLSAVEKITGEKAEPTGFPATCDAYFLSHNGKTPTVIFGPGSLSNAHSPDEHVDIAQLEQATKIYVLTAYSLMEG